MLRVICDARSIVSVFVQSHLLQVIGFPFIHSYIHPKFHHTVIHTLRLSRFCRYGVCRLMRHSFLLGLILFYVPWVCLLFISFLTSAAANKDRSWSMRSCRSGRCSDDKGNDGKLFPMEYSICRSGRESPPKSLSTEEVILSRWKDDNIGLIFPGRKTVSSVKFLNLMIIFRPRVSLHLHLHSLSKQLYTGMHWK